MEMIGIAWLSKLPEINLRRSKDSGYQVLGAGWGISSPDARNQQ